MRKSYFAQIITPNAIIDKLITDDQYISDEHVKQQREELYEAVA
ncbi:hypothetical protein ACFSUS_14405 [Spirosoma soli]|uniref:Uncharacterized protein n=1 Tax=Spirosoma soli TaxID=1770529 RepID=A0ABW5M5J7_9BACT